MRRTVLALLAATALVAGCGQPAEGPAAEPASAPAAALPPPEMPADAPPQEEVDPALAAVSGEADTLSCRESAGEEASTRLVERCRAVSPATHPPCNAVNPCRLIEDEIARACGQYAPGETRPAECAA
jgi:hypothetical protein